MLSISHLKVWYPIKTGIFSRISGYVRAVDDVSLELHPGETLGIVGESSCGKTTLGRAILGLEKPQSGDIIFNDITLTQLSDRDWRRQRRHIQMIFQDPFSSLDPRMTARDLLLEGLNEYNLTGNGQSADEAVTALMSDVGLSPEAMFRYPHEFSGGQRQRLAIARAISLKPEIIVCDEPVSALDVSVQAQVLNLLIDLKQKYRLSYLFISHDLNIVRHISDRIAVMNKGKIVEIGTTEQIMTAPQHEYTKKLMDSIPKIAPLHIEKCT